MTTGERVSPQCCPYCGEEDLRPHEASHGAWECRGCARVFAVKFLGLSATALTGTGTAAPAAGHSATDPSAATADATTTEVSR